MSFSLSAQTAPRIDTFRAPNGKWSIDHYSKDNGWEKSYLALRHPELSAPKKFVTIDAAIQGGPIWSADSHLVAFNTGYSTYMYPYLFQISDSGAVKEVTSFSTFYTEAERSGRVPRKKDIDYGGLFDHTYLRCRYFDAVTNSYWFTFFGEYALKGAGQSPHVTKKFCVQLDARSLKVSLHDDLPHPADPAPPPRAASFGLKATGTGFVIDTKGHVLTCYHVVDGAAFIKVDSETASFDAVVAYADKDLDVAVLEVLKLPVIEPLPLQFTAKPELADEVFTIGFPNTTIQGFSPKYTRGEISSLTGPSDDPNHIQISVPVQPGNSGGALVTNEGLAIGIVDAKLNAVLAAKVTGDIAQNVNYALKANKVSRLIEKWKLVLPDSKPTKSSKEAVQRVQRATVRISVYGR
ncbi:MAG: S1C family serine protease [Verrucomicrobiales bacterium]